MEKWITPSVFISEAADEYTLCKQADWAVLDRIREHRETFITRDDFVWLAEHGVAAVRLPVGYWVFGEAEPYRPAIRYVDRAFKWAEETGIKILLDLHGAPGSQNGNDHSGQKGAVGWDRDEANVIRSLDVILRLSRRYRNRPALLGFELLNEPSAKLKRRVLRRYYESAYRMIRAECGRDAWVVFSDGFRPRRFKHMLHGEGYSNVCIDTHQYQTFSPADKRLSPLEHIRKTVGKVARTLDRMARYHPVIVGEWNLTLDRQSLEDLDESQLDVLRRAYAAAQLLTYGNAAAWFFWNYKSEGGGTQSYRDAVSRGWIPSFTPALDRSAARLDGEAAIDDTETAVREDDGQYRMQKVADGSLLGPQYTPDFL